MLPLFTTLRPSSTTEPWSAARMSPRFSTPAALSPAKRKRALLKSASAMPNVVAVKLPTSTRALAPNSTPFGFTRNSFPLAFKLPKMPEASLPVTRNSASPPCGCTRLTRSPAPMPKLRQLTIAETLPWAISSCAALGCVIVAWPATSLAPCGRPKAWGCMPNSVATASATGKGRGCFMVILLHASERLDQLGPAVRSPLRFARAAR